MRRAAAAAGRAPAEQEIPLRKPYDVAAARPARAARAAAPAAAEAAAPTLQTLARRRRPRRPAGRRSAAGRANPRLLRPAPPRLRSKPGTAPARHTSGLTQRGPHSAERPRGRAASLPPCTRRAGVRVTQNPCKGFVRAPGPSRARRGMRGETCLRECLRRTGRCTLTPRAKIGVRRPTPCGRPPGLLPRQNCQRPYVSVKTAADTEARWRASAKALQESLHSLAEAKC